jgi:hypothetical protein
MAASTRHDLDIYNEACAFSVTCESALEQIMQSDDDMKDLFQKRLVIAQELVQDDEFSARVVVGDELLPDEEGWLGRVTGILHIPCGRLLVCAGFDLDALYDFNRMGQNEYFRSGWRLFANKILLKTPSMRKYGQTWNRHLKTASSLWIRTPPH